MAQSARPCASELLGHEVWAADETLLPQHMLGTALTHTAAGFFSLKCRYPVNYHN